MPTTGDFVLLGEETNSICVHPKPPPMLSVFPTGGSRSSSEIVLSSCKHEKKFLGVEIDGQNFLFLLCNWCKDIKLLLLRGNNTKLVDECKFTDKNSTSKCRGEPGIAYVCYQGGSAHEYRYSSSGIDRSYNIIETGEDRFSHMCCITSGQRALVGCIQKLPIMSIQWYTVMRAIAISDNSVLWEFNEEINGTKLGLTNILYVPQDNVILVDDADNNRFVVFNPTNGSFLRTLKCMVHMQMPQQISKVRNIDINNDKLSVLYSTDKIRLCRDYFIAVFTVQLNPLV